MSKETDSDKLMILIVGRNRSGTTLLVQMLNAHPDIDTAGEANILNAYKRLPLNNRDLALKTFKDLYYKGELFEGYDLEDKAIDEIFEKEKSIEDILRKLVYHHFRNSRGKYLCIKRPKWELAISALNKIFPNSKIIYMIRDPRGMIASTKKFSSTIINAPQISRLASNWNRCVVSYESTRRRLPSRIDMVRYEDLVKNSREELQRLCKFLNIEFKDRMLEFDKCTTGAYGNFPRHNSSFEKKENGLIFTSSINKWKETLKEDETSLINSICGELMKRYGYEL